MSCLTINASIYVLNIDLSEKIAPCLGPYKAYLPIIFSFDNKILEHDSTYNLAILYDLFLFMMQLPNFYCFDYFFQKLSCLGIN